MTLRFDMAALLMLPATLLLSGCQSGSLATPPEVPAVEAAGELRAGSVYAHHGMNEAALGVFRLDINRQSLTGSISPEVTRSAVGDKQSIYDLPLTPFIQNPYTVHSIRVEGPGAPGGSGGCCIVAELEICHPFNAPGGTWPGSLTGRADLGVAIKSLILVDVPSATGNTYFAASPPNSRAVANTDVMCGCDGYMRPEGMVDTTGMIADTFPYVLAVDEVRDPRVDVSNGMGSVTSGSPITGNFAPSDGWQGSTLFHSATGVNQGWTGMGVLHQGQCSRFEVRLNCSPPGPVSVRLVPIARWQNPASAGTPNRRPQPIPDVLKFGYRMPHGCWDEELIQAHDLCDVNGLSEGGLGVHRYGFHVRDSDARATAAGTGINIGTLTNPGIVPDGASGLPTLHVDVPGFPLTNTTLLPSDVLNDDSFVSGWTRGDVGQDTGYAGDELWYAKSVTASAAGISAGTYRGMVMAVDVEDTLATRAAWPYLAFDELMGPANPVPRPTTYQVVEVPVAPSATTLLGPGWARTANALTYVFPYGIAVGPNGTAVVAGLTDNAIDFGTGAHPTTGKSFFLVSYDAAGTILWEHAWSGLGNTVSLIHGLAVDAAGNAYVPFPIWGGTIDVGGGARQEALSATVAKFDPNGNYQWDYPLQTFNGDQGFLQVWDVSVSTAGQVAACGAWSGTVDFGNGFVNSVSNTSDGFVVAIDPSGAHAWHRSWGATTTTAFVSATALATPPLGGGEVVVAGEFHGETNFGNGLRDPNILGNVFILHLSPNGSWLFDKVLNCDATLQDLDIDYGHNHIVVGSYWSGDFGGGPRPQQGANAGYLAKYDWAGGYLWDRAPLELGMGAPEFFASAVDANGAITVAGPLFSSIDFGGGLRPVAGPSDAFMVHYDGCGDYQWDLVLGGAGGSSSSGFAISPLEGFADVSVHASTGEIFAAGQLSDDMDLEPGAGITNHTLQSAGVDMFVERIHRWGSW